MFIGNYLINDLYLVNKVEILKKVKESTRFSLSFIILLIGSGTVCTIGLLLNNTALVIGGMIISPLMWPLMQASLGISYGQMTYIRRAIVLLLFAVALTLISSFLITHFSPVKVLNDEILSRTNPTLLDIVIALVAGGVAALAVTQPKISESLAGVAIATSLMPPLAVSGIGLALVNFNVFYGAFLLFVANAVSIVFVSIIVFLALGLRNAQEPTFQKRALAITAILLLITSVPLFIFLRQLSLKTKVYSQAETVIVASFKELSQSAYVSNINTELRQNGANVVLVEAEVLIPEDLTISFDQRQALKDALEQELGVEVDLRLRLQRTISVLSQSDIERSLKRQSIENAFIDEVANLKLGLTIDTLEVFMSSDSTDDNEIWIVNSVLRGDPTVSLTFAQQQEMKTRLEKITGVHLDLNMEIISRVKLQTQTDDITLGVRSELESLMQNYSPEIRIDGISVNTLETGEISVLLELKVPSDLQLPIDFTSTLTKSLNDKFAKEFTLQVVIIYVETLQ